MQSDRNRDEWQSRGNKKNETRSHRDDLRGSDEDRDSERWSTESSDYGRPDRFERPSFGSQGRGSGYDRDAAGNRWDEDRTRTSQGSGQDRWPQDRFGHERLGSHERFGQSQDRYPFSQERWQGQERYPSQERWQGQDRDFSRQGFGQSSMGPSYYGSQGGGQGYGNQIYGREGSFGSQGYGGYGSYGSLGSESSGGSPGGFSSGGMQSSSGMGYGGYGGYGSQGWERNRGEGQSMLGEIGQNIVRRVREFVGKGPKGYSRSDQRIEEEVNERLSHGYLDASEIEVTVKNGEVTLTGFVMSKLDRRTAEDLIENTLGVKDVENKLKVKKMDESVQKDRGGTQTGQQPGPGNGGGGRRAQS